MVVAPLLLLTFGLSSAGIVAFLSLFLCGLQMRNDFGETGVAYLQLHVRRELYHRIKLVLVEFFVRVGLLVQLGLDQMRVELRTAFSEFAADETFYEVRQQRPRAALEPAQRRRCRPFAGGFALSIRLVARGLVGVFGARGREVVLLGVAGVRFAERVHGDAGQRRLRLQGHTSKERHLGGGDGDGGGVKTTQNSSDVLMTQNVNQLSIQAASHLHAPTTLIAMPMETNLHGAQAEVEFGSKTDGAFNSVATASGGEVLLGPAFHRDLVLRGDRRALEIAVLGKLHDDLGVQERNIGGDGDSDFHAGISGVFVFAGLQYLSGRDLGEAHAVASFLFRGDTRSRVVQSAAFAELVEFLFRFFVSSKVHTSH